MKKFLISLALATLTLVPASADEGMWLLPLLESLNIDIMAAEGCRLSAEQIYSVNHSSLKDAIVQFDNGCTAEMISKKGLLITNHHCGYSRIQELSTPEHNWLHDGFWAKSMAEELPCPGLTVKFLHKMTDVTDHVNRILEEVPDADEDALMEVLMGDYKTDYDYEQVELVSFYNDNVYYLISYIEYRDVRLVGTPPEAIGKFGGDTDNWEWPRHTGDFSMFRIYTDKKGAPADYNEKNVPYKPAKFLKVSVKGVKENDFTMVMGYPGSTQRFMTVPELEHMEKLHDISVAARLVREDLMWEAMCADPVIHLKYADKYSMSTNARKKWQGEKLAFAKLGIIEREREKEVAFLDWCAQDEAARSDYRTALDGIAESVYVSAPYEMALNVVAESLFNCDMPMIGFMFLNKYMEGMQEGDADAFENALKEYDRMQKDCDEALERKIAVAMMKFYRENQAPELVAEMDSLAVGFDHFATMDLEAYTDYLYDNSVFASRDKLVALASNPEAMGILMEDPALQFTMKCYVQAYQAYMMSKASSAAARSSRRLFTKGLLEWQAGEGPFYPDANFTMRLTYGHVLSYSPKDGLTYRYYTTSDGILEKEDPDNPEFIVPADQKELILKKDFGRYADPSDGKLHLCFLTDNDITGGNSGSPVLDADGNLIGLAFDGNWESMSSDVMFEPELQRCICVDIRYVLFCIDKLGGAKNLIKEMTFVKK